MRFFQLFEIDAREAVRSEKDEEDCQTTEQGHPALLLASRFTMLAQPLGDARGQTVHFSFTPACVDADVLLFGTNRFIEGEHSHSATTLIWLILSTTQPMTSSSCEQLIEHGANVSCIDPGETPCTRLASRDNVTNPRLG
jgi:hypothetical protein